MHHTEPRGSLDAAIAAAVIEALESLEAQRAEHPLDHRAEPIASSITDAARRTGLSRSTLYRLMDAGDLGYVKVGARRLIPEEALRALMVEKAA